MMEGVSSPNLHGGLLAVRDEKSHLEAMEAHKIRDRSINSIYTLLQKPLRAVLNIIIVLKT